MSKQIKKIVYYNAFLYLFFFLVPLLLALGYWINEKINNSATDKVYNYPNNEIFIVILPTLLTGVALLYLLIPQYKNRYRYRKHTFHLKKYDKDISKQKNIKESSIVTSFEGAKTFKNTISQDKLVYSDVEIINYIETNENHFIDLFFSKKFKSSLLCFSLVYCELSRKLPQIIFDSKKYKGKIFKLQYSGSQIYDFEGDFHNYFDTYIPKNYKIDVLSFISPEVLWTIREAAEYDIEIIENKIFLIGPTMEESELALKDMMNKLKRIADALEDNIDTYRDDRLPYKYGRIDVSAEGKKLNNDLEQNLPYIAIVSFSLLAIASGIVLNIIFITVFGVVFLMSGGVLIYAKKNEDNKKEKQKKYN